MISLLCCEPVCYKNKIHAYMFTGVDFIVECVEIFHILLWNIVMFKFVVQCFSVNAKQVCSL